MVKPKLKFMIFGSLAVVCLAIGYLFAFKPSNLLQYTDEDVFLIGTTDMGPHEDSDFRVKIIGTMNFPGGPGAKLLLFKFADRDFLNLPVISGMSGSPVRFGDKIVGAVSYRIGSGARENYGGITPLEIMLDHKNYARTASTNTPPTQISIFTSGIPANIQAELLKKVFQGRAVAIQPAVSSPEEDTVSSPIKLEGGDGFTIFLMTGDVSIGASGTVTYIDEEKGTFLGFGHPFLGLGDSVQMPVKRSKVLGVVKSGGNPFKLFADDGQYIGAIVDDFFSGVEGQLGLEAPMLPVDFTITQEEFSRHYSFKTVRHNFFTPTFVEMGINSLIQTRVSNLSDGVFHYRSVVEFEGDYPDFIWEKTLVVKPTVVSMGMFSIVTASSERMIKEFSEVIRSILRSRFPELRIRRIDFNVSVRDNTDDALYLDSAVVLNEKGEKVTVVKLGSTVKLVLVLRSFDFTTRYLLSEEIKIPTDFNFIGREGAEKTGQKLTARIFIESGNKYKERDPNKHGSPYGLYSKKVLFDSASDFINYLNERQKDSSDVHIQIVFPSEFTTSTSVPNISNLSSNGEWSEIDMDMAKEFRKYDAVTSTNRILKKVFRSPGGVVVEAKSDFTIQLQLK